jgi:hypothetical protein
MSVMDRQSPSNETSGVAYVLHWHSTCRNPAGAADAVFARATSGSFDACW